MLQKFSVDYFSAWDLDMLKPLNFKKQVDPIIHNITSRWVFCLFDSVCVEVDEEREK